MCNKWYKPLVFSLALLSVAPAYGMGWFRDFANSPQMRGFADNIGKAGKKFAEGVGDAYTSYKDGVKRRHEENMEDLRRRANDMSTSKAERDACAAELLREYQKKAKSEEFFDNLTGQVFQTGIGLLSSAAQGVIDEGKARAAQARELQKVGLEAKIKGKAIVQSVKDTVQDLVDPKNHGKVVLSAGALSVLYFGSKHGIAHIADLYKKPALADDENTSLKFGPINWMKSLIYGKEEVESSLSDVILKPELAVRINETVKSLQNTVKNGGYLKNIMLWGQPGTGKTMLAKRMARSCGLQYIYFSGSSLEMFSTEEAAAQVVQLFRYAQNSPDKLMIIIDEAEKLVGSRRDSNATDKKGTLLNLILTYTGTESRDYMVTILTNIPEDIDEAFLSRCDERIQIGSPAPTERKKILELYVDKILRNPTNLKKYAPSIFSLKYWFGKEEEIHPPTVEEGALSDQAVQELSDKLGGFVGRDISKLVIQIQSSAFATEDNKITAALIKRVVDTKLQERKEEMQGFVRDASQQAAQAA